MKAAIALSILMCTAIVSFAQQEAPGMKRVRLPNGWSLSPAGKSLPLGDLPLNTAISSSQKLMAVTNNGQSTQSIQLIDLLHDSIVDNIVIPYAWLGLAFANNDRSLFVSAGNKNQIWEYAISANKLVLKD